MNNIESAAKTDPQTQRIELIFITTIILTLVHGGFVSWDLLTMIPGGAKLFGLQVPNTIAASAYMSTIYLAFLCAYSGFKEFVRWATPLNIPKGNKSGFLPEEESQSLIRVEILAVFWTLLLLVSIFLLQMRLISRLPLELMRTALQVSVVLIGVYTSKGFHMRKRRKYAEKLWSRIDFSKIILEYVEENGPIDNTSAQRVTGLPRYRALRVIKRLQDKKLLVPIGNGRGRKYIKVVETDNTSAHATAQ